MTAMDEEEGKKENAMSLSSRIFGRSRFAHFAGGAETSPQALLAKKPEEEDEKEKEAKAAKEKEEEEAKRRAEEEEEARRARRSRRARKARKAKGDREDGDDDADEAGDDGEEEDDEEEMKKAASAGHDFALAAAFRAGARAQRRRCAAIFAAKAAAAHPLLAMSLAFETSMTADAAVAVLEKQPAPARTGTLAERMAASGADSIRIAPAAPEGPKGEAAIAASWAHALKDIVPAK